MAQITFDIADENLDRIANAVADTWKIPVDSQGQPLFAKSQWAKEGFRRYIVRLVRDYEQRVAAAGIDVPEDLIT